MLCTEEVVPPTIKNAWSAPKASAASSSASFITDMGWQRLSKGFMEFTSRLTHFSPKSSFNSGFPLPRLCPGTSKGTTLFFLSRSRASYTGACFCASIFIRFLTSIYNYSLPEKKRTGENESPARNIRCFLPGQAIGQLSVRHTCMGQIPLFLLSFRFIIHVVVEYHITGKNARIFTDIPANPLQGFPPPG